MVLPASALISLRSMVRPAPLTGLYSRLSACCCTEADAFITVWASPKPSDAPNPVMVWYVVAPLMDAVSWAAAGPAPAATPVPASRTVRAPAATRKAGRRQAREMSRGISTGWPFVAEI